MRVAATSINLSDWEGLTGSPGYARIGGLRKPRRRVLGSDIAGVVDAVGDDVTGFQPGDEVYGDNLALMGGFAEYAIAAESSLVAKPAELTFAQASTIPQAGAIAREGHLARRNRRARAGQRSRRRIGRLRDPAHEARSALTSPASTTPGSWTSCGPSEPTR